MTNILGSGQALTVGGVPLTFTDPNAHITYQLIMQNTCILSLLNTTAVPNVVIFSSPVPNPPPGQTNAVVCTMTTDGYLKVSIGPPANGQIICTSTNTASRQSAGATLILTAGVATITSTTGVSLWNTTMGMKLSSGALAQTLGNTLDQTADRVDDLEERVGAIEYALRRFDNKELGSGLTKRPAG